MFNSILDAETQLVGFILQRYPLDVSYTTYNNQNDPTKSIRLGIKNQIKPIQANIDAANLYLTNLSISPVVYSMLVINSQGFVVTPWSNSSKIVGTVAYNSAQLPSPSIPTLQTTLTNLNSSISDLSPTVAQKQQTLQSAQALDNSNPFKTVLVQAAQDDLTTTQDVINALIDSKNGVTQSIATLSVPTPTQISATDTFSQNVKQDLHNLVSQKTGYNQSLNDDEAVLIMRKKTLDAYYTAKTPQDKQVALDRLNAISAKMLNPSVPLTRKVYNFDPSAFPTLNSQINVIDAQLVTASNTLLAAQNAYASAVQGGNPATIAAALNAMNIAQAIFNSLNKQKSYLMDTLFGFRDSPNGSVIAYDPVNSITVANQNPVQVPYSNPSDATSHETLAIQNQFVQQQTFSVVPPGSYVNVPTGTTVPASKVTAQQSGINVNQKNPSTATQEQIDQTNADVGYATIYNNTVEAPNKQLDQNQATYDAATAPLYNEVFANNFELSQLDPSDPANTAQINALNKRNAELTDGFGGINDLSDIKDQVDAEPNKQVHDATIQYQMSVANRAAQETIATQTIETPASGDQASAITQNYADATDASNAAQLQFSKQYQIAIDSAVSSGVKDPNDPSQWNPTNQAAVAAAQANLNTARENETTAATQYDAYANTPDGQNTLLKSGYTQDQINATKAQALTARNNNATIPNYSGYQNAGLTATSLSPQNQGVPSNGFEGINGGAPFYMQFPTMKTLKDFHIRNGISPYGNQSPADIARNAIHFNIFEVIPPAARAQIVPGTAGLVQNVVDSSTSNTLGSFTIYPSEVDQTLQMTHQHTYGQGPGLPLISNILSGIETVDTFMSIAAAVGSSVATSKEQGIPNAINRKLDSIEHYESTAKQKMTTSFTLFTRNDFIADIFKPLMFLTALSYPKRELHGNIGNNIKQIGAAAQSGLNSTNGSVKSATEIAESISQYLSGNDLSKNSQIAGNAVNNVDQKLAALNGIGPFRYYITQNPEYMSVRHASGLFYFPLAFITSLEYSFEGPWYNYDGVPIQGPQGGIIDKQLVSGISSASNKTLSELFSELNPFSPPTNKQIETNPAYLSSHVINSNDSFIRQYKLPYAYPTRAICTISYQAALPLFRDDYLSLFYAAGQQNNPGGAIVQVSEQQTSTINKKIPRASINGYPVEGAPAQNPGLQSNPNNR